MAEPQDAHLPSSNYEDKSKLALPAVDTGFSSAKGPHAKNQDRGKAYPNGGSIWDGAGEHPNSELAAEMAVETFNPALSGPSPTPEEFTAATDQAAHTLKKTIQKKKSIIGDVVGGVVRLCESSDGYEACIRNIGNTQFLAVEKDASGNLSLRHLTRVRTLFGEMFGNTDADPPVQHITSVFEEAVLHMDEATYATHSHQFTDAWEQFPESRRFALGKIIRGLQNQYKVEPTQWDPLIITIDDIFSLQHILFEENGMETVMHPITDATVMILGITDGMAALTDDALLALAATHPDVTAQEFSEILVTAADEEQDRYRRNSDNKSCFVMKFFHTNG